MRAKHVHAVSSPPSRRRGLGWLACEFGHGIGCACIRCKDKAKSRSDRPTPMRSKAIFVDFLCFKCQILKNFACGGQNRGGEKPSLDMPANGLSQVPEAGGSAKHRGGAKHRGAEGAQAHARSSTGGVSLTFVCESRVPAQSTILCALRNPTNLSAASGA